MPGEKAATTPDVVVLSLLAEQPRHGYDLNKELERREVRDWAGISRPQVYYSLKKAHRAGWIAPAAGLSPAEGPERQIFELTARGRDVLVAALEREDWATHRPVPPFLTWLALSPMVSKIQALRVVQQRRSYLEGELDRERRTIADMPEAGGPGLEAARLMITLTIRHFEVELVWLSTVEESLRQRTK